MSALPKNLVPMPKATQVAGIKSQTVEITPVNGSFTTSYAPLDRIIFQIPSYPNGFLDVSKSFLKFKPTLAAASGGGTVVTTSSTNYAIPLFAQGVPIFERMIVKSGSGAVLEDIQDADLLENLLSEMKEKSQGSADRALLGDHLTNDWHQFNRQQNNHLIKRLPGGVFNSEYYLPLHLMGGPYALEVELVLNSAAKCMRQANATASALTEVTYTISGVQLQLEVVNMPGDVCQKLDMAICGGEELVVPFSTYRSYRNIIPTASTTTSLQIHEVSPNVQEVMLVLEDTTAKAIGDARYEFEGGSEKASGNNKVDEYQFRYADRYMPLQPVKDLANGSAPALMNLLRDLPVENPVLCAEDTSVDGGCRYFVDKFFILQNMEVDKGLVSGLSTQAHAGPIETFLKFSAATSAALRATQFAKSSHNISISRNGVVGLGMVV
jgi:hypothetical protein